MKPKSGPSTPIHLDSGQRKELSYLIEGLRQDIREPKKNEAGNGLSKDAGERRKGAAVRRAGHWGATRRQLGEPGECNGENSRLNPIGSP